MEELENSLSDIEEIDGALKIIHSYPLISLNFFRKLRLIKGNGLTENYALYVLDNQNLESLFNHDVVVARGKMFFRYNSKLCYRTIEAIKKNFVDLKGVEKLPIAEVAVNSNGDNVACKYSVVSLYFKTTLHEINVF